MLKVKASQCSVEVANPRQEHEWKVRRDAKLPPGKNGDPRSGDP
jgi:hypothetical protein